MNLKEYAHKIGFFQPNCVSWTKEQKIKKIMNLISKGVKIHIFEDKQVGIIYPTNYIENFYRKSMIEYLGLL